MLRLGTGEFSPYTACRLGELSGDMRHRPGDLALYDYLFATAVTLRAGFALSGRFLHLVTAGSELRIKSESGRDTTYSYSVAEGNRGSERALKQSVDLFCERAREGTGRPVAPVRVQVRAVTAEFTFLASDLDFPMRWADPVLTRILVHCAEALPPRRLLSWLAGFRGLLGEALEDGSTSLEALAQHLHVSPRTLQRRLADHGTTWRAELDFARQRQFTHARQAGTPSTASLAHQLGYSDGRALRRARRRWEALSR